jgi:hypothetical protein
MDLTPTFPARLLPLLVPDGGTLDSTWVVCHAHRPTVEVNGIPALGDIDGWQPTIPFESQDAAAWWAEKFARATADEIDELEWVPIFDDGPGGELYAVLDDGTEHQCDLAIVPLTLLARTDSA